MSSVAHGARMDVQIKYAVKRMKAICNCMTFRTGFSGTQPYR